MPVSAATPSVINGVALLTRSGNPKSRYSETERLQVLSAAEINIGGLTLGLLEDWNPQID